jgi:protein CMS1
MKQGGDDLGDDFAVDDIVALSGDEDLTFDGGLLSDSGATHDAISGEEGDSDRNPQLSTMANAGTEKKRKRREREKERKAKVRGPLPVNYV